MSVTIQPRLLTYFDAVEHLRAYENAGASDVNNQQYKEAVLDGLDELQAVFDWSYYHEEAEVSLVAPYETGTWTYTHTGGAAERLVTFSTALTGDALNNTIYYRLQHGDIWYPIDTFESNTTATLRPDMNPGADVTTAVTTKLMRSVYTLPSDFKNMDPPHAEQSYWNQQGMTINDWSGMERHINSSGNPPYWYAVGPDPNLFGQMALYVQHHPSSAEGLRFIYRRFPRQPKFTGFETNSNTGTVAISSGATAVTGSGTTFTSDMVGSILRIGDTSNLPGGLNSLNPFVEQHTITGFSSTTSITIGSAVSQVFSGEKFRITSPIDVRPTMIRPFKRACEVALGHIRPTSLRPLNARVAAFTRDVKQARAADSTIEPLGSSYGVGMRLDFVVPSVNQS